MEENKEIITVITAVTGDRIIVCRDELVHAMKHFLLPEDIFLELLERVLKEPDEIFVDDSGEDKTYYMFYRLFEKQYIVSVVKIIQDGAYFASMYSTGEIIRKKHRKLKKIKP